MQDLEQEIRHFCAAHHLRLHTDLGQHFLINEEVLRAIVASADIQPEDHILEIGPGIGILTRELIQQAGKVTAIELDHRLIPLLKKFISAHQVTNQPINQLTIIEGNALQTPFPTEPYKVVANIPYHITSPLLRNAFLESPRTPTSMTLLIQWEVAKKICDENNRGMLTILVGLFGAPSLLFKVPPSAFLPPPEVDSAVLHIESFPEPRADRDTIEKIFQLTKIGFGQKRKMLRNTIGKMENGMAMLAKTGIDPMRRPETMNIDEWIALAGAFRG